MQRPLDNKYTRVVSRQRFGIQVARVTNRRATIEVLLDTGVFTRFVPRCYKEDSWDDQVSSVQMSVKGGLKPEAEE
jgi:hypothetical protein